MKQNSIHAGWDGGGGGGVRKTYFGGSCRIGSETAASGSERRTSAAAPRPEIGPSRGVFQEGGLRKFKEGRIFGGVSVARYIFLILDHPDNSFVKFVAKRAEAEAANPSCICHLTDRLELDVILGPGYKEKSAHNESRERQQNTCPKD